MNALLPVSILLCVLAIFSSFGLPRLVERITGRSGRTASTRYRVVLAACAGGSVLLAFTVFGNSPFLWQIVFGSITAGLLSLLAQAIFGTRNAPNIQADARKAARRLILALGCRKEVSMDLQTALPALLPKAIEWAEKEALRVATLGRTLTFDEIALAHKVGVAKANLIRVQSCEQLPVPQEPLLNAAAVQTGLLGPGMVGLTLGYAIFVCIGHETRCLLAHEFRHVFQYEQSGSIAAFFPVYLQQIVTVGYESAPLEIGARAYEGAAS